MNNVDLKATLNLTESAKGLYSQDADFAIKQAAEFLIDRAKNFPVFNYTEWAYGRFLNNKIVQITGGADTPGSITPGVGKPHVHVRINGHLVRQGGPCDVLYHTGVGTPDISETLVSYLGHTGFVFLNAVDGFYEVRTRTEPVYVPFLKTLRQLRPSIEVGYFAQGEWLGQNPYGPSYEWLNDLHKKYNCKFFTGNVALAHIMRFNPAKIFVTGMTMYAEKTQGQRTGKVESHEIEGNLQFLKDASKVQNVIFSNEFKEALDVYQL